MSLRFSRTCSYNSRQRAGGIFAFMPTARKSSKAGRDVELTEVACSPLYPSVERVNSYAGARCHIHLPLSLRITIKLKFLQWSSLLSAR